ncbi:MAG: CHAD domain-containing protein [Desulfuromonadales bacterium]|nr:CHAD domain-containing protein [Desulfuromonadales bacterium]
MSKKITAHTSGIGEQAGVVLFSQWNEICRLQALVLSRGDTDSIHDLRVASRRMRATIGLFAPFIAGKAVRKVSKELRRVTRKLGRLRNVDEAMIYVAALPGSLPDLAGKLRTARVLEMKAVAAVLKTFPRQDMDRVIREAVAALAVIPSADETLPVYLSETSIQRYQAVYDLLLPATDPESAETRHALRIAIKKWRYLLETLGQVCRQDYSAALETLKGYQTLLGSLNDLAEFGNLCDTLRIPDSEKEALYAALARDTGTYLARFIETAASQPPQYTYLP